MSALLSGVGLFGEMLLNRGVLSISDQYTLSENSSVHGELFLVNINVRVARLLFFLKYPSLLLFVFGICCKASSGGWLLILGVVGGQGLFSRRFFFFLFSSVRCYFGDFLCLLWERCWLLRVRVCSAVFARLAMNRFVFNR